MQQTRVAGTINSDTQKPLSRGFFIAHIKPNPYAMDEPSYWWQTAITAALGTMAWLGNRAVSKVDAHEQRIKELEEHGVSESDLENTINRFDGSMKETKAAVDQTNKTVLELWKFLAEKK